MGGSKASVVIEIRNPRDYANVSVLAFDSDNVWLPDIAMTNSADHLYGISKDTRFVVRVNYDGTMKFVPTGTSRTWCDLKLLTFPFDIQTCGFEFESWALDSGTMTFNRSSEALIDDNFASPQWELCNHQATVYHHIYDFSGESFTRLRFDFVVRRKPTFYVINLIFPCATLSAIQLLVFTISSTDTTSDRVGFGTTNLLTLVVFQTIITQEMPKSSDSVTALSKYVIGLIIISSFGILQSVIVERVLRMSATEKYPPPQWLMIIVSRVPLLWQPQLPTGVAQLLLNTKELGSKSSRKLAKPNSNEDEDIKNILTKSNQTSFSEDNATNLGDPVNPAILAAALTVTDSEQVIIARKTVSGNKESVKWRPTASPLYGKHKSDRKQSLKAMKLNQQSKDSSKSGRSWQSTDLASAASSFLKMTRRASSFIFERRKDVSVVDPRFTSVMLNNARLWGIVMTKFDVISLTGCAAAAIFLPVLIFAPLMFTSECSNPK